MKETRVYNLPLEPTRSYFQNHIKCGKYLSESICKAMDFTKGRFFTILPIDIDLGKLLHFEHGGILTSSYSGVSNASKTIVTMDGICSQYIHEYLNKSRFNVAVVENYMLKPDSEFSYIDNVQMSSFNSDVYYLLYKKNSVEQIYKTIRKSSLVWHFLTVLSFTDKAIPDKLPKLLIHDICANARYVIAGAYDGEGYIFWEKNQI